MLLEIQNLIDSYIAWLKDRTTVRQVNETWSEITTPYTDRHNDCVQIYAMRMNAGFVLSDDGYTIDDLEQSGCKLESAKRQALLKQTLNGFGVELKDDRILEVRASVDNFASRKHNLIQAMLAVNDLFYLAKPRVASLFFEDVENWLELHEIRYTPRVKFTGKSGYDHLFNFVIPKSKKEPERVLEAVNRPTKEAAQRIAFSWIDTKEVRPADAKAYALLNDADQPVASGVIDALRNYDVQPVPWSERQNVVQELAA